MDEAEVASVHRVLVADLVDPANRLTLTHPSGWVGPAFEVGDLLVWGFTAGVVDRLLAFGGWELPWDRTRRRELDAGRQALAARSSPAFAAAQATGAPAAPAADPLAPTPTDLETPRDPRAPPHRTPPAPLPSPSRPCRCSPSPRAAGPPTTAGPAAVGGGSVTAQGAPDAQTATVVGNTQLKFVPDRVEAAQGTLALTLTIEGGVPHNLVFDDTSVGQALDTISEGSATGTFVFPSGGTYQFVCTLHPGMEGEVVVS